MTQQRNESLTVRLSESELKHLEKYRVARGWETLSQAVRDLIRRAKP